MSAIHGKIKIDGIPEINGKKYLSMSFIQGRSSGWVKNPFFAEYNESACGLDKLEPAFGDDAFFFNRDESGFMGADEFYAEIDMRSSAIRRSSGVAVLLFNINRDA